MTHDPRHVHGSFVPAAGHPWALPLYDPLARWTGADRARRDMLAEAAVAPGARALDVGCGTGTLLLDLARLRPDAALVGLDPDPDALARTRRKLARAGVHAELVQGSADRLPFPDLAFDHVFSSLMFHHLDATQKTAMLAEVRRVLRPGGRLHLLDFTGRGHGDGGLTGWIHRSHRLQDNDPADILARLRAAGLDARQRGERRLLVGRVAWYEARQP